MSKKKESLNERYSRAINRPTGPPPSELGVIPVDAQQHKKSLGRPKAKGNRAKGSTVQMKLEKNLCDTIQERFGKYGTPLTTPILSNSLLAFLVCTCTERHQTSISPMTGHS